MKHFHKLYFYISFVLTAVSGIGLWIVSDFFKQQTPYGVMPHPHQAYWLDFHLISLPLTTLGLGGISISHIIPQWKKCFSKFKRYSGIILTMIFFLSVLSGYAIQIHMLSNDFVKEVHEISSLGSIFILFIHIYACLKKIKS